MTEHLEDASVVLLSKPNGKPATAQPGPWLILLRLAWLAVAVLQFVLFLFSSPHIYDDFRRQFASEPSGGATFLQLGFSQDAYAAYNVAFQVVSAIVYVAVAAVIVWCRSDRRPSCPAAGSSHAVPLSACTCARSARHHPERAQVA